MFEYAIKVLKQEAQRLLDKEEKLFTKTELAEFNQQIDELYQAIEVLKKAGEKQLTDRQIIASGSALELAESRGEWETELYYTFVELMETGKKYKLLLEEE